MKRAVLAILLVLAAAPLTALAPLAAAPGSGLPPDPLKSLLPIPNGASRYLESCGGCHGLTGSSAKREIPELKGHVGRFACTAEGRAYIGRLPNVAFANLSDQNLAEAMNYMVFTLGGTSAPKGAKPYSAREIGALRKQPLKATDLTTMRTGVLGRAVVACDQQASR